MQISRGAHGFGLAKSITPHGRMRGAGPSPRGRAQSADNLIDTTNVRTRLSTTSGVIIGTAPVPGAARRGQQRLAGIGRPAGANLHATEIARHASNPSTGARGENHMWNRRDWDDFFLIVRKRWSAHRPPRPVDLSHRNRLVPT